MADERASSSNGQETGYAVAVDGGIAYITLNRVADRNRLTNLMIAWLSADLAIHDADPAIKLILLERERIKRQTIEQRRLQHRKAAA